MEDMLRRVVKKKVQQVVSRIILEKKTVMPTIPQCQTGHIESYELVVPVLRSGQSSWRILRAGQTLPPSNQRCRVANHTSRTLFSQRRRKMSCSIA
jgi:hypothetical protein